MYNTILMTITASFENESHVITSMTVLATRLSDLLIQRLYVKRKANTII
jgi:hypothetical protein